MCFDLGGGVRAIFLYDVVCRNVPFKRGIFGLDILALRCNVFVYTCIHVWLKMEKNTRGWVASQDGKA